MKANPKTTKLLKLMAKNNACGEATDWIIENKHLSLTKLWQTCPQGDWMLWLAAVVKVEHKLLVLSACDCAERALRFVPKGEDRPRQAIDVTRAWCRGKATLEQVQWAAWAAESAAWAAAESAESAESAAESAAWAAAWAAKAARSPREAAWAAESAKRGAARSAEHKACADVVRKRISASKMIKACKF